MISEEDRQLIAEINPQLIERRLLEQPGRVDDLFDVERHEVPWRDVGLLLASTGVTVELVLLGDLTSLFAALASVGMAGYAAWKVFAGWRVRRATATRQALLKFVRQ